MLSEAGGGSVSPQVWWGLAWWVWPGPVVHGWVSHRRDAQELIEAETAERIEKTEG